MPSVTQILDANGLYDFSFVQRELLEWKAKYGTSGHNIMKKWDEGLLNLSKMNPLFKPILEQYLQFIDDYGVEHIAIEKPMYADFIGGMMIAGTPDRVSNITKGIAKGLTVIDFKLGVKNESNSLQTAGYKKVWDSVKHGRLRNNPIRNRFALYLTDKKYRVDWHREPTDEALFTACATVYYHKKRRKLI